MTDTDPRIENSIPADTSDDEAELIADFAAVLSPTDLGRMLLAVGRTVSDEEDLLQLLQQFVEIAHQAIDGADSSGVTIDMGGRTYTAVHTDERTLEVDRRQYDADEGPCLHAARTGTVVRTDAETARDAWPEFAAAAREEGIRSFLAAPLFANEQAIGSFNLYGRASAAFDRLDAEILDLLTTSVSRALADFARFQSANRIAETIQRALENRAPIEQAKGMLMALHQIDADAAFDMLRRESQAKNVKLHVIAQELVERLSEPGPAAMA
jgi:transcriptional regulator with GAF, ATPase, and Fis domain